MPVGAIVGAVGSIASSVIGGSAAGKAADAQAAAAMHAADLQNQQYQQTRSDLAPWRAAGSQAIGTLSDMLQPGYDYTASPGYQWRLSQGVRARDSSASSKGLLLSGGQLKSIERYGQDYGAQDFNDQFGRVATVANAGQQAATNLGQLGAQSAANQGNFLTQAGQARASGYLGQANAINGGIGNLSYLADRYGIGSGGGGFNAASAIAGGNAALSSIPIMTPFSGPAWSGY